MTIDEDARAALRDVADEVQAGPDAWARIERGLRARRVARAASGVVLVLAVVAGGIVGASLTRDREGSLAQEPSGTNTYRHLDGWSWTYPRAWDAQRIRGLGRVQVDVVRVASVGLGKDVLRRNRPVGLLNAPPADGVIIEMRHLDGGIPPVPTDEPDTTFPVSLDDADPPQGGVRGGPLMVFQILKDHGRYQAQLEVWIGPQASDEDAKAARAVVSSMEFDKVERFPCGERGCPVGDLRDREAVAAALADPRVQDRIAGREYEIAVEGLLIPDTYRERVTSASGRCAVWECRDVDLTVGDSTTSITVAEPDLAIVAVVDQLTDEEAREGHRIADADPDVRSALPYGPHWHTPLDDTGSTPEATTVSTGSRYEVDCGDRRCALVWYYDSTHNRLLLLVLVDLADRRVVKIYRDV
jgi:hypothetical protein